jgi:hypothetical protein
MKPENTSNTRGAFLPEKTLKNRTKKINPGPRKVVRHSSERTRLSPIIVSAFLLLLAISPMTLFFHGDDMAPIVEGSPVATVTGTDDDDYFGWNVSGAGDVNGDGYDDVIVGAPGCNGNTGSVYLFFGGPWFSGDLLAQNANVTLSGDASGALFGWDVSDAGDVNNDGFDDVIVGAPGADRAYIIFGNSSLTTSDFIPNTLLNETFESGSFSTNGWMTQNGSLNDGGAPYQTPYIHQNGSNTNNPSSTLGAVLQGGDDTDDQDGVGSTSIEDPYLSIALDLSSYGTVMVTYNRGAQDTDNNHDSGEDFRVEWTVDNWTATNQLENTYIVGNLEDTGSPSNPIWGQCTYILPEGSRDINFTLRFSHDGSWEQEYGYVDDVLFVGTTGKYIRLDGYSGSLFGSSVSGAGDVNQDGYDDVIIGAPGYDNDRGAIHSYFGRIGMDSSPDPALADLILCGDNTGDKFGSSVSCAGDVNNDGFDDIIAGAPGANRAYVFLNYDQVNPLEIMLFDDFEDGILADWYEEEGANGAASVGNASSAINGTYHLTDTDDTDCVSPVIDARGYNNLILTYKRRMREGAWSGNEDMLVMIRVDGGSWVSIPSEEAHGDTQTPDLIENRQVDLSPYGGNNSLIEIKFDLNDGGFLDTQQEWDFDDVRITGTPYFTNVILVGENPSNQFGFAVSNAGDVDDNGYDNIIIGAPSEKHWWDSSWLYRQKLTFNNSGQSETLVDFPVLINLSTLNFNYSRARMDGLDLRFMDSDDVTELRYHIEDWNTSGASYIWVNVTSIDGSSDTDFIWMYYGNLAATNVQDEGGTYDDNFSAVWHLNETGTGIRHDTTQYSKDGIPGGYDGDEAVFGKIDGADEFDGANDGLDIPNSGSMNEQEVTLEAWVYPHDTVSERWIISKFLDMSDKDYSLGLINNQVHIWYEVSDSAYHGYYGNVTNNAWQHISVVYTSWDSYEVYLNGNFIGSDSGNIRASSNQNVSIGYSGPFYYDKYFDGIIDEVRISSVARSADWISAQYLSMNNSFITFGIGGEETQSSTIGKAYIFDGSYITAEAAGDRYINLSVGDTANVTLIGESSNDLFGHSVSSARNLTGDGFSDVIVGAPGANGIGAVYVYYGGASMPSSIPAVNADYLEIGENANDGFGWSVSGAGDAILADGFDEVIIGAPFRDPILNIDAGRAYILGAVSRPVIRDVSALPNILNIGGNANVTCQVTAIDGVGGVWINLSLPGGGYANITMTQGSGDQWYYNNTYITIGTYQYTIWASDTNGNWTQSSVYQFNVVNRLPTLLSGQVNPSTGFVDTLFNFTVTYTDLDDHVPGFITVNITGIGVYGLFEVDPLDIDYTDGKEYYFDISGFNLGQYTFHFAACDTVGNWTESSSFQFDVIDRPPALSLDQVSPITGAIDTWFNFTVMYTDMDDQAPDIITLNITGVGVYDLIEVDLLDVDYSDGKEYYFNMTGFGTGQYTFHFAANQSNGNWIETGIMFFDVLNRVPALSLGQVTPTIGFDDTFFNFTVTYSDLDDQAPDTITVNITGLGIYQLNELDALDMDYTDGKQYFIEITAIPLGTSYSFHFAANDTLGNWAVETPEIDAPDVLQRAATLTALDETVEYSDVAYLNATLMESGTPIAGEDIEFYIDLNDNGIYEPGEVIGSATTLGDGSVSVMNSAYLVPGTYNFTAVYIGSGGFDINDSYAHVTIIPKPASLTAVSRIAEENEVISLSSTLMDIDGNPVAGEGVEIYLDRNKNAIYEASEMVGYQTTSAGGDASITYTVTLSPGNYDIWARYRGSGNYSVTEIEGVLIVQNTSNTPPTILGIVPDQIRPEDSMPWTLDLTTFEADIEDTGSDLNWFLTGVDSSLCSVTGFNSSDDVFIFIPKENAFGNNEVILWLVDGSGDWDSQVMWINITPVNDVPYFDPNPPNIFVHYNDPGTADDDPTPWDYTFYVHDIETPKEGLTILTSEPTEDFGDGYSEITSLNVTFHYPQSRVGDSILVTLTLYDGSDSTQTVITVNVTSDWVPELVLNLPDIIIEENITTYNVFDLDDYFEDRDHDSLFFSSGYQHLTVVINADNTVDITTADEWTGSELITFRAMDPTGAIVEDSITVTVIPVNDGPVISGAPDLIIHYDYSYGFDFTPYIEDPDNSHSELSIWTSETTDNIWIQEYNNLGIVVNYPESMDGMTFPVTIFVSDGVNTASQEIQITISDNFPPELMYSLPDVSFDEDTFFEDAILLSYYFLDIDGDALFFSNGSTFINVVINNDLTVDFSAPENWNGFETVTFRATDPTGSIAEDTILIVVVPVNDAPTIDSIPGQEKNEGDQWVLDLLQYINDVDNEASELIITVESGAGQGYVTLTGDILVFQYPEGIDSDIVTITVSDGELETQRSFNVTLQSHTQVAPPILDNIPWLWILLISFAAMSGAFAFYAQKRRYNVYEAFLIHEKGQSIAHASYNEDSNLEDVVVSGMFTAVQDFISDAFSGKTQDDNWKLDEMKFGDNKILIERSENLYLAAIFEGNGERLGSRMRTVLKDIDDKYAGVLTDWDGDMTELVGISAVISALVSKKAHKHAKSEPSLTREHSEGISVEIEDANPEGDDIGVSDNEEQETNEIGDDETLVYECPECQSEIRSTDVRCPICGVEFSEMNDLDPNFKEEDNEIDNLKDNKED